MHDCSQRTEKAGFVYKHPVFSERMKHEGSISQQNRVNRVFKLSPVSSSKTQSLFTFAIVILATFTHHSQIS